jgi:hypothetical protein
VPWAWIGLRLCFGSLARNMILTHARAVDLYRRKYQSTQNGTIGITLVGSPSHAELADPPEHRVV